MNQHSVKAKITNIISFTSKTLMSCYKNCLNKFNIKYQHLFIIVVSLIFIPSIVTLSYIKYFGVNVPWLDEWNYLPIIDKFLSGTITFSDLWSQHNEHRLVILNILVPLLASVTHYNVKIEMYISWIVSLGSFLVILKLYIEKFGKSLKSLMMFIPAAWLFFSLIQYENIIMGTQLQVYLTVFGFICAIYFIRNNNSYLNLLAAIIFGVVSTFSQINGLIVWPIGLIYIYILHYKNWAKASIIWGISGLLAWISYFYNWVHPASSPSMLYILEDPLNSLAYIFVNIGAPISGVYHIIGIISSFVIGVIIFILILLALRYVINNKLVKKNSTWITFILFSLGTTMLCVVGRSGFGVGQAVSSRYITMTVLGIIGLYFILIGSYNTSINNRKNLQLATAIVITFMIVGVAIGFVYGVYEGYKTNNTRTNEVKLLENYNSLTDQQKEIIYPYEGLLSQYVQILHKYNFSY